MPFLPRTIPLPTGDAVSAVLALPDPGVPRCSTAVILAHGAGNDMHAPFVSAVHAGLATRGFPTLKFNFPYKERGGRAPDRTPVLEACFRSVLDALRADPAVAAARLVIGGKSLGGRMASHLAADGADVAGVLLLGYPLHPARQPDRLRAAHLTRIRVPMLFIAGTRDALCALDLLHATIATLQAPVTLHIVDGGDHSFAVPTSMRREPAAVWEAIVDASADWLGKLGGDEYLTTNRRHTS